MERGQGRTPDTLPHVPVGDRYIGCIRCVSGTPSAFRLAFSFSPPGSRPKLLPKLSDLNDNLSPRSIFPALDLLLPDIRFLPHVVYTSTSRHSTIHASFSATRISRFHTSHRFWRFYGHCIHTQPGIDDVRGLHRKRYRFLTLLSRRFGIPVDSRKGGSGLSRPLGILPSPYRALCLGETFRISASALRFFMRS